MFRPQGAAVTAARIGSPYFRQEENMSFVITRPPGLWRNNLPQVRLLASRAVARWDGARFPPGGRRCQSTFLGDPMSALRPVSRIHGCVEAFSTGSSETESSLALRCMTTSPSVTPNADATISTLSLLDSRRTVDRLTNSGTSRRHRNIGVADA